jgi:hypothetical protein
MPYFFFQLYAAKEQKLHIKTKQETLLAHPDHRTGNNSLRAVFQK